MLFRYFIKNFLKKKKFKLYNIYHKKIIINNKNLFFLLTVIIQINITKKK